MGMHLRSEPVFGNSPIATNVLRHRRESRHYFCFKSADSVGNNCYLGLRQPFRNKLMQLHATPSPQRKNQEKKHHISSSVEDEVCTTLLSPYKTGLLVYPLVIAALSITALPLTTSLLAIILYGVFSYLATKFVLEDDLEEQRGQRSAAAVADEKKYASEKTIYDPPPVYFLAFSAALLSAGVLTPLGIENHVEMDNSFILPLGLLAIAVVGTVMNSLLHDYDCNDGEDNDDKSSMPDPGKIDVTTKYQRKLMELWDEKYRKDSLEGDDHQERW
jgi:hypothetical protein